MIRKIFVTILVFVFMFNMSVFAKGSRNMNNVAREEIADKNLEILFNITTKNNNSPDKDFMDILQKYIFGEVFTVGDLDIKTRELLTVTSLTVMQTLPQLKAHINGALNAGNTPIEIRETIYQCAPFIGFPKTLNAISVFNEVIKERGLEKELKSTKTTNENDRYKKGFEIQNPMYGDEIVQNMKGLPDNMGEDVARYLTEVCFGDFYTRGGLDVKTRELMTIAILTTTGNTGVLKSHIKGNLKAGNSIETITAAIIQVMPYVGFPNSFAALKAVKDVMSESKKAQTLEEYQKTIMFPIGNKNDAYSKYFIGQSYISPISTEQVKMYNVTFEPKCRNNWHIHKAKKGGGQILIAIGGRGYYQEWGKKTIELKKGDVVNIPANVKHWHGAAPDSWFSHIAVEVDGIETSNEWLEPVSDKEYNKLK